MDDQHLTRLFEQALERTGAARSDFLASLDAEQRQQVEQLLRADESVEDRGLFQPVVRSDRAERPVRAAAESTFTPGADVAESRTIPAQVGRYKILEQIGEGGMGSVFMAEQSEPLKRRVALKVIKAGMDSEQVIARFEAERQVMAMMDHAHIAKVFDAGVTDNGLPYFVMELVHGVAITKYCDEAQLTPKDRLLLFIRVCRAIQHAHQKGIIHRDIKPSNILVTQTDGKPSPKVIDFGLAKALQPESLTEKTLLTNFGQVLGTLEYMSPEQAELNSQDIDTRSDVYSLGVLLYELLTGCTPIGRERLRTEGFQQIMQLIREEEPQRPSQKLSDSGDAIINISKQRATQPSRLSAVVSGDLDWIALKALEKNRQRRYDGAAALADEIERYLSDEPIEARPPSVAYRLTKTYRRHRLAFGSAILALILLLAGLAGTATMWLRARAAELDATAKTDEARTAENAAVAEAAKTKIAMDTVAVERDRADTAYQSAIATMARSRFQTAALQADRPSLALQALIDVPEQHRGVEWYLLRNSLGHTGVTLFGHRGNVGALSFSPDGTQLVSSGGDHTIRMWDTDSGQLLRSLQCPKPWGGAGVTYSSDGTQLLSTGSHLTVRLWDAKTGSILNEFPAHQISVASLSFSPDGSRILTGGNDSGVKVWDALTGKELLNVRGEVPRHSLSNVITSFSPDGSLIATRGRFTKLFEASSGREVATITGAPGSNSLKFTPNGSHIAWCERNELQLYSVLDDRKHSFASVPNGRQLEFSPDSRTLAVPDQFGRTELQNWRTGVRLGRMARIDGGFSMAFSPDARRIAIGHGSCIELVSLPLGRDRQLFDNRGEATCIAISPDGNRLAWGGQDGVVRVGSTADRKVEQELAHGGEISLTEFSPDGSMLAVVSKATIDLWDSTTFERSHTIKGHRALVTGLAFSLDGHRLVTTSRDKTARVWDTRTGEQLAIHRSNSLLYGASFSPDGLRVGSLSGGVTLWNSKTGEVVRKFGRWHGDCICFSHSGERVVASQISDHGLSVWSTSGELLTNMTGHRAKVCSVMFSRDDERIISAAEDGTLRVWDANTGDELLSLDSSSGAIVGIAVPRDERFIALASRSGSIELRHATAVEDVRRFIAHASRCTGVSLSRDGKILYSKSRTDRLVWDVQSGALMDDQSGWKNTGITRTPDGLWEAVPSGKNVLLVKVELWNNSATQARRAAKPDPAWHDVQATAAEVDEDWFAATFHRAWQLKHGPESRSAYEKLGAAHRKLKASENSLAPPIAREALTIPEPPAPKR
ncbi:MAG: protein kinase [Planctomycetaceae bacterium]